jgi:predicted DNA-binding transcriptional regulator AlpA
MTDAGEWLTGPQVARHFNISTMGVWRWMHDERIGFPQPTQIRKRNYWRVTDIRDFEKRMVAAALRDRGQAA